MAEGLRAAGHAVIEVLLERDGRWTRDGEEIELRAGGGLLGAEVAFPVLHGPFRRGRHRSPGLLECLDLAYVGPGVLAAAVAVDKLIFKRVLALSRHPSGRVLRSGRRRYGGAGGGHGPASVGEARTVGLRRRDLEGGQARTGALDDAVELARRHDPRVIVEAHGDGREVECSVLGNEAPRTSPPGEIVTDADWYDYEAKYAEGGMDLIVPAPIGDAATARVRERAARVFGRSTAPAWPAATSSCVTRRGSGQRAQHDPGLHRHQRFAKLLEADGLSYPELCDRLVRLGVERYEKQRGFEF